MSANKVLDLGHAPPTNFHADLKDWAVHNVAERYEPPKLLLYLETRK